MALVDQIIGAESSGNPNAANPASSAGGLGQFVDSTWLDMLAKHRPDLARLPPDRQLALKSDPDLSRQMTEAYAADNSAVLGRGGFAATPGNVYLAHFLGPQGALAALSGDPTEPAAAVLPRSAIRANPFLARMTVGDLRNWASSKMAASAGTGGVAPPPPAAVASAPAPSAPPGAAPPSPVSGGLLDQLALGGAGGSMNALGAGLLDQAVDNELGTRLAAIPQMLQKMTAQNQGQPAPAAPVTPSIDPYTLRRLRMAAALRPRPTAVG